jgi:hypothetical protein
VLIHLVAPPPFSFDPLCRSRIASIIVIILGSCFYIYVKHSEQQAKTAPTAEYQLLEQMEEGGKEDAMDNEETK